MKSNVVRSMSIEQVGTRLFHLPNVEEETQRLFAEARKQADRIRLEAETEAQGRQKQAHEEGVHKGYEEGYERGKEEGRLEGQHLAQKQTLENLQPLVTLLKTLDDELPKTWQEKKKELEEQTITFLQALILKIVHGEMEHRPEVLVQTIKQALDYLAEAPVFVVQLNELDYELIQKCLPDLLENWNRKGTLQFDKQPNAPRGQCRIHTEKAQVEAGLSIQAERLLKMLIPPS